MIKLVQNGDGKQRVAFDLISFVKGIVFLGSMMGMLYMFLGRLDRAVAMNTKDIETLNMLQAKTVENVQAQVINTVRAETVDMIESEKGSFAEALTRHEEKQDVEYRRLTDKIDEMYRLLYDLKK